jgi:hypothetical protein
LLIELLIRFIVGGLVVCAFAVVGDVLRPKTFAGIFGAAPSVALATLGLTLAIKGPSYAGIEGRSMIAGAVALLVYGLLSSRVLLKQAARALPAASVAGGAWLVVAFGIWGMFLR